MPHRATKNGKLRGVASCCVRSSGEKFGLRAPFHCRQSPMSQLAPSFPQGVFPTMITPFTGWSPPATIRPFNELPSHIIQQLPAASTSQSSKLSLNGAVALKTPRCSMPLEVSQPPPRYIASGVSGLFANCLSSEM